MVLKIRFRTSKFYLKYLSLYLLWKEKKRRAFAKTYNGSGYGEKGTPTIPAIV